MQLTKGIITKVNNVSYWIESANLESEQRPGIFLIHGLGGNRTRLQGLWDFFKENGYPITRIDLKGHGSSEKDGDIDYSFSTCATEIDQLIRNTMVEPYKIREIAIIGHSMGGIISQILSIRKPSYLTSLILLATVPRLRSNFKLLVKIGIPFYNIFQSLIMKKEYKAHAAEGLEHFPEYSPEYEFLKCNSNAYRLYLRSLDGYNIVHYLDALEIPVLVIGGMKDSFSPPKILNIYKKKIPNVKVVVYEDSGHYPFLNHPSEINHQIKDYIML